MCKQARWTIRRDGCKSGAFGSSLQSNRYSNEHRRHDVGQIPPPRSFRNLRSFGGAGGILRYSNWRIHAAVARISVRSLRAASRPNRRALASADSRARASLPRAPRAGLLDLADNYRAGWRLRSGGKNRSIMRRRVALRRALSRAYRNRPYRPRPHPLRARAVKFGVARWREPGVARRSHPSETPSPASPPPSVALDGAEGERGSSPSFPEGR